jgi:hypothetical protein
MASWTSAGGLASDRVRARDVGCGRPGLLGEPEGERDPGAVHQAVGHVRGDQLAAEAMAVHAIAEALREDPREVADELGRHVPVVREVGVEKRVVELDLGVGQEDRELGRHEAATRRLALGHHLLARQRDQFAVQPGGLLQVLDEPRVDAEHRGGLHPREAQRLGLAVVVPQD